MIKKNNSRKTATQKDFDILYKQMMTAAKENDINFVFAAFEPKKHINISFGRGEKPVLNGMLNNLKKRFNTE